MAERTGETVVDIILDACRRYPDNIAFTCLDRRLRYRDLENLSGRFAAYLHRYTALEPGDRIAIQMPNVLQYPVAAIGALRAGLVVVNTNPQYSPPELAYQLNDAGVRALVVLANTASAAAEVVDDTPVERVVVSQLGDLHGTFRGPLMNLAVKHVKRKVPRLSFPRATSFRQALALGRAGPPPDPGLPADPELRELAVLQYTGGTTGRSMGAMLTHANLAANTRQFQDRLAEDCPGPGGIMVAPLPLFHIYAFTVHLLYCLSRGLNNLLIPNPRDIPALVKTLRRYPFAGFVGINTLYNALCASSEFCRMDFSNLRLSCAGGMALSRRTYQRWLELTGCRILEGYGLTETSPLVACNCSAMLQEGTIGTPVKDTEVKVIDEQGQALPAGEPGELCVRGPQVMAGYWRRPEVTREVLDGALWLRTGDIAVIQPDGFLRIVDRLKDLIIVSGFNVYPAEIEAHVCAHPDIREAVAVGVRCGDIGEKVKLFLVSDNPALDREAVIAWCERGLAPYKVPRLIQFCDALPKSSVGKLLRRELRESA